MAALTKPSSAVALEREKRRTAREQRAWEREKLLWDRLLTPPVVRLAIMAAIIAYSTQAARSKENVGPVQSALAFALPGLGIPLLAADAGIKDRYALAAISATSVGYVTGQMLLGWKDAGILPDPRDLPAEVWRALTPWTD